MHACSVARLCPAVCDPVGGSPPGSSVHGLSWQKYWSGLLFLPPGYLPDPGMEPASPLVASLAGGFFTTEPPEKPKHILTILIVITYEQI